MSPLQSYDVLQAAYELTVDIALHNLQTRGTCETALLAVAIGEHSLDPETIVFNLLDPRLHLYVMQVAVRERPNIFGFVFVGMGTVILPIDADTRSTHPALLTVQLTRDEVKAYARLIASDPIRGRSISVPGPAPDAVVEHYRKVFTGDKLPPSYYPLS